MNRRTLTGAAVALGVASTKARSDTFARTGPTGKIGSISRIAFGPQNTLFVADWVNSNVHAVQLPAAAPGDGVSFNIDDLDAPLQTALGADGYVLEDMAARPGSNEVYIALSIAPDKRPAVVVATADGTVRSLDLTSLATTTASLEAPPSVDLQFWGKIPGRSFTVTDMVWRDSKLYLAGLSNQDFASTLRVVSYPFDEVAQMASIEMYHTVHDQIETRAPIRAMAFVDLDGEPHLLAAYLCTPLVTIPLNALRDGAHIKAKTIAEMGYAGTPVNLLSYRAFNVMSQKPQLYVLVANLFRESSIVPLASVEEANRGPGYSSPTPFGEIAGVQHVGAATGGALRIDDQDDKFLVVLRRDLATGRAQLVSINKSLVFRLSDFDMSEYLFPDYAYTDPKQVKYTLPMQNMLKVDEGYGNQVR